MLYYELRLVEVNEHWLVTTMKAVHDGMKGSLGFSEARDIVNAVHEGDEKVLYDGSDFNKVLFIMKELDSVHAEYNMHNYYD